MIVHFVPRHFDLLYLGCDISDSAMGESMKFVPFNSMINPGFWTSLTKTKLDVSQPLTYWSWRKLLYGIWNSWQYMTARKEGEEEY